MQNSDHRVSSEAETWCSYGHGALRRPAHMGAVHARPVHEVCTTRPVCAAAVASGPHGSQLRHA